MYYPGGEPIAPGTIVRLPGLADVLREWVERGAALLDGPVGDAIAREVATRGGALTADDFELATAEWMACAAAAARRPPCVGDAGSDARSRTAGSGRRLRVRHR